MIIRIFLCCEDHNEIKQKIEASKEFDELATLKKTQSIQQYKISQLIMETNTEAQVT